MAARKQRQSRVPAPVRCRSDYERAVRASGHILVAGLDEAGRGCLFGPVHAAAVILSPDRPVPGLADSKELEASERERLAILIRKRSVAWAVSSVEAEVIDRINILEAARLAMKQAAEKLDPPADYLLVDAVILDTDLPQRALIHGDARCRSIAAASIIAKVERDAEMRRLDGVYPGYGFASHKGYGTPEHLRALERIGPTPLHRRTFAPVREVCGLPPLPKNKDRRAAVLQGQMSLFAGSEGPCR